GQYRGVTVGPAFGRLARDLAPGNHLGRVRGGRTCGGRVRGQVHGSMVGSLARGLILGRRHVSFDAGGAIPGSAPGGPFLLGACGAGQVLLVGDRGHVLGQRDRGKGLGLVLGRGSVLPVIGLFRGRLVFVLADGRLVLSLAADRLVAVLPKREAKSQAHVPYSRTRR